jgi:hypothetical protein
MGQKTAKIDKVSTMTMAGLYQIHKSSFRLVPIGSCHSHVTLFRTSITHFQGNQAKHPDILLFVKEHLAKKILTASPLHRNIHFRRQQKSTSSTLIAKSK